MPRTWYSTGLVLRITVSGELDHRGDHQDKGNCPQVLDAQGRQQVLVHQPGADGGQGQDEGRRHAHADSRLGLFGYPHEGAEAKKFDQHKIVDQHSANQNQGVFSHGVPGFFIERDWVAGRQASARHLDTQV